MKPEVDQSKTSALQRFMTAKATASLGLLPTIPEEN
jgi:hypothetical protein